MKALRTIGLVIGGTLSGLGLLGIVGIVVSAVVGVNAFKAGDHETAGLAKLACVVCMGATGLSLIPGVILLGVGTVSHVLIRRFGRQEALPDNKI